MTRILIVEDNEMNLDMLSRRLVRRGFDVLSAEDGQAGVDMAKSDLPDLILMDISLPVLDGWGATEALKGDTKTSGIPIIVLTANAMEADRERAFEVGADGFETKPVDFPALLSAISSALGT